LGGMTHHLKRGDKGETESLLREIGFHLTRRKRVLGSMGWRGDGLK